MIHLIRVYLVPALLMTILSLLFWDKVKDAQFQSGVMNEHKVHNDYHNELEEVERRAKLHADNNRKDKFTGTQGDALEKRIERNESRINALEQAGEL